MASLSNPPKLASGTKAATGLVFTEAGSIFIEPGFFQLRVGGTFDATWKLVRTTDDPASSPTWYDVEDSAGTVSNTTGRVLVGYEAEGAYYNVNVTVFASGTLAVRIAQGHRPV